MNPRRLLTLLAALAGLSSALLMVWGWRRGLRIARHDHSSPCGIWARGLVVSNHFGEPRLELVYSSINWHYGLAWLQNAGRPRWLGLGDYPGHEPANFHPGGGPSHH